MSRRGPLTEEEREFAAKYGRGAGAAAVLLFLHVVLVGYLLCALWYLVAGMTGEGMAVSVQWWWQVFLPAWLAVLTYLPTNPLTRGVGKAAVAVGGIVLLAGCGAWFAGDLTDNEGGGAAKVLWFLVVIAGSAAAAALVRWGFGRLLEKPAPDIAMKDADDAGKP